MGDFAEQTELESLGDNRFRAMLYKDWMLWGPNGGYVSAIALRAAGAGTKFRRPVSYACQYLSVASFDPVDLQVESLRTGKRTEALRVTMTQGDRIILTAQVWAMNESKGMEHDFVSVPDLPDPDSLTDMREPVSGRNLHPFMENFEQRPIDWAPEGARTPKEPELEGFFRFTPRATADDPFLDAARALILIDTFTWTSTYPAYPSKDPSPWIAPNLDLYVRFHREMSEHPWLYCKSRADLAEAGLIAAQGQIFGDDGKLLASGHCQLLCRSRPEQFK